MEKENSSTNSFFKRNLSITSMLAIGSVTRLLEASSPNVLTSAIAIGGFILAIVALIGLIKHSIKKDFSRDIKIGWILFIVWIISNVIAGNMTSGK